MVERKLVAPENHLAIIRQDMRDYVAAKYACSHANIPTSPAFNDLESGDN